MDLNPSWFRSIRLGVVSAALAAGFFASTASSQTVSGKWVADWKVLYSGEQDRMYLDLTQSGKEVTGTLKTIGRIYKLQGSIEGPHFELFSSKFESQPRLKVDVGPGQLRLETRDGDHITAVPAQNESWPQQPEQLPLPMLKVVPRNDLAKTPPMGWNSWNTFAARIDDKTVREIADAMVASGMRDAGYTYINIDDTWEGTRDAQGHIRSNKKFPDMKALADYLHARGLKLGLYSSPGPRTCADYIGSYGHEDEDAKTFAAWGIDLLKYDWCSADYLYSRDETRPVYQRMGEALQKTGRPIVFSLCQYGYGKVEQWGSAVGGNMWRTTGDISDSWQRMMSNIHKQLPAAPFAGPGHWNDPDMLEVGNGHMTDDEYRTHMSLWALSAAPLLAGNDIRSMTAATKAILMNPDVLKIDQDPLGKQATMVRRGDLEFWTKPLLDGSFAVGIVNISEAEQLVHLKAADLGLPLAIKSMDDLWTHRRIGLQKASFSARIPKHGILLLKVR